MNKSYELILDIIIKCIIIGLMEGKKLESVGQIVQNIVPTLIAIFNNKENIDKEYKKIINTAIEATAMDGGVELEYNTVKDIEKTLIKELGKTGNLEEACGELSTELDNIMTRNDQFFGDDKESRLKFLRDDLVKKIHSEIQNSEKISLAQCYDILSKNFLIVNKNKRLLERTIEKYKEYCIAEGSKKKVLDIATSDDRIIPMLKGENSEKSYTLKEIEELLLNKDSENNCYTVRGKSGSGKTFLLLNMWKDLNAKEKLYTIFVPCYLCGDNIENYIKDNYIQSNYQSLNEYLDENYEEIKTIILIDGMNSLGRDAKTNLMNMIENIGDKNIIFIISTTEDNSLSDTVTYKIKSLDEKAVCIFLEDKKICYGELDNEIKEMINNPQLLTMFADVYENNALNNLNKEFTICNLFNNYIAKQKSRILDTDDEVCMTKDILFDWLMPFIAHQMNYNNQYMISENEFNSYYADYEKRVSNLKGCSLLPNKKMETNELIGMACQTGILFLNNTNYKGVPFTAYSFKHDNFRDYFAALNIFNNDKLYFIDGGNHLTNAERYLDANNICNEYYNTMYNEKVIEEYLNEYDKNEYVKNVLGDIYCYPLYQNGANYDSICNKREMIRKGYGMYSKDAFGTWSRAFCCEKAIKLIKKANKDTDGEVIANLRNIAHNICMQQIFGLSETNQENHFFEKASDISIPEMGHADSKTIDEEPRILNVMGNLYMNHIYGNESKQIALVFYVAGAIRGVTYCANNVGNILEKQAYSFFKMSAEKGDKWAARKMCEYLIRDYDNENEKGIAKYKKAEKMLENIRKSNVNGIPELLEECKCKIKRQSQ